ncbi:hypothetical protein ACHAXT_001114 [Thalassiosira profunda]
MRAVIRTGLLGTTISFSDDQPHPLPDGAALKPTALIIKVKAAAINPVDYKLPRMAGGKGVGFDVSGVVEKVGSGVSDFAAGDEVFGRVTPLGSKCGSLADYAIVEMEEVAKKPVYLSFDEAAALGVAYLTGFQSLGKGNGPAEGAVSLGSSLPPQWEMAKNADVLELVDYSDADALKKFKEENAGKFDCIYDTATASGGGEDYESTFPTLLKEGTGEYVQINGKPMTLVKAAAGKLPKQRNFVMLQPKTTGQLEEVASLLEKGGMKPHLNIKSFDEKGVDEGFEALKSRRTKGKIVFSMD